VHAGKSTSSPFNRLLLDNGLMNKTIHAILCVLLVAGQTMASLAQASTAKALVEEIATKAQVVVFGEVHGTQEAPNTLQLVVRSYVQLGYKVNLAIEVPNQGVASAVSYPLREPTSKFWTHGKDGRSSTSMLQLIRSIGTPDSRVANVIGFADVVQSVDQIHLFDELAARRIADLCRPGDKKCRTVVLVGNAHSSLNGSSSIPSKLEKLGNQTYVVNFVHDGGAAWVCISGRCGATPIANPPRDGACKTERIIYQDRRVAGVDAEFCLPTVTPSPPAKSNGSGSNLPQAKEYPPRPL